MAAVELAEAQNSDPQMKTMPDGSCLLHQKGQGISSQDSRTTCQRKQNFLSVWR